jgi:hypothetical protein
LLSDWRSQIAPARVVIWCKCEPLGFGGIAGLKRNLRACFAIADNGGACSLE